MRYKKRILAVLGVGLLCFTSVFAEPKDYKLGVLVVVDQFRADYLMRFKDQFKGGYKKLLEGSAYFPLGDHGLFQNVTGPGHAALLSGSYPYRNHISMNTWYDRDLAKRQYCVQDDSAKIIGSQGIVSTAQMGISPKNFNADTVGDELKNVDRPSRVVSVSLKDRAAVLMGGKRADYAIWFDDKNCQWVSSQYYVNELPNFAKKQNLRISSEKSKKFSWGPYQDIQHCSKDSLRTPWAMEETFKLATSALDEMKLGQGKDTDLLLVSLSSHDYLGHMVGPNDESMEKVTLAEDELLGKFLNDISKKVPGGLQNVFVVLTGDHGMPPSHLPKEKMPSENLPENEFSKLVEEEMSHQFGKAKGGSWVESMTELQIYFNQAALKDLGKSVAEVVRTIRPRLLKERYVDQVWARDDILFERKVPAGEVGTVLDRTLSMRSGDLLLVLKPYYYSDGYPMTHMTHYSYDRYVPILFFGKTFKPGTYRQIIRTIDIAPTLSSVLHVLPPSQSEGRVITEILR